MVTNPSEDIITEPERSILEFGNGYSAQIFGAIDTTLEDGTEVRKYMIKPSQLLRKRYNIQDELLNKNGQMPYVTNKGDLIPINVIDDSNRKWLYIKTFDHKETIFTNLQWELREEIEQWKKRVWFLEGEIIWYSEQLNMAKSNPTEFMAQGLEFFERISSKNMEMLFGRKKEE